MIQIKNIICIAVCLFAIIGNLHGADDYTDENRPYEFGFTIDGEQHRHEKKDKNGIIMGEFGFITADGVYHVTVYATDENGRFKILSMKNIRVKPYPTAPGVKKGHSLPFPPSENAPVLQGPKEQKEIKLNKPLAASPAKSCSHCSLPTTTTTTKAPQLSDIAVVATNPQTPSSPGETASKQGGLNHGFVPQNNQQYQQNHPEQLNSDLGSLQPQNIGQKIPEIGSQLGQSPPQDESTVEMHSSVQGSSIEQSNLQNPQVIQKANDQQNYSPQQNYVNANNGLSGIVTDSEYPKSQQQSISNGNHPQNTYVGTGKDNHSQKGNTDLNNYPQEKSSVNQNNYPQQGVTRDRDDTYTQHATTLNQPQSPPTKDSVQNYPGSATATQQSPNPQDNNPRNPKQYNDISSVGIAEVNQPQGSQNGIANKPTLIAAQMQIVPKNTDIHHKGPGEQEGLPDGVSKDDVTNLLYTFNYTVGFHGHHEEGYTNGAKQGYYYVTGRNGIRTRVDYVADEKGFRPRISQIALDVLSDDVPKPETEKDEKFGLKGYEFKWLYYPADNKPQ